MLDLSVVNGEMDTERGANPVADASHLGLNDVGLAKRLALYAGDSLRFASYPGEDRGTWWVWGGLCWREARDGEMQHQAMTVLDRLPEEVEFVLEADRTEHLKWAEKCRMATPITNMLKLARGLPELWIDPDAFDARPYLLNTINGTLDLSDGRCVMRPHNRDDLLTRMTFTPYLPGTRSALLDTFLDTFLEDLDERRFLLTSLAVASLIGGNQSRAFMMIIGPTTTGKTTLISLLAQTFGLGYVSSINPSVFQGTMTDRGRPDVLAAISSRLVYATEGSDVWELHADQIKRLSGADPIPARRLFSNTIVEKITQCTPLIVANEPPQIKGADEAIRRRLHAMLMGTSLPTDLDTGEKRDALINSFEARAALLALLVELYVEHAGSMPKSAPDRFGWTSDQVFAELDDVDATVRELKSTRLVVEDVDCPLTECLRVKELYDLYLKQSGHNGRSQMTIKMFSKRLAALGFTMVKSGGGLMRVSGLRPGGSSGDYFRTF